LVDGHFDHVHFAVLLKKLKERGVLDETVKVGDFQDEVDFVVSALFLDLDKFEEVFPVHFLLGEVLLKKDVGEFVEKMGFFMMEIGTTS
jgi:hypothetical protein